MSRLTKQPHKRANTIQKLSLYSIQHYYVPLHLQLNQSQIMNASCDPLSVFYSRYLFITIYTDILVKLHPTPLPLPRQYEEGCQ